MGFFNNLGNKYQKKRYDSYSFRNNIPLRKLIGVIYPLVLSGIGIFFGMYKILYLTVPMLLIQGFLFLKTTKADKDSYREVTDFSDLDFDEDEDEEGDDNGD